MPEELAQRRQWYDKLCTAMEDDHWTTSDATYAIGENLGGNLRHDRLARASATTGFDSCGAALVIGHIVGWTGPDVTAPATEWWSRRTCAGEVGTRFLTNTYDPSDAVIIGFPQREPSPTTPQEMVQWLYDESGLTWDQLSRILGVSRRSVHAWANGQRVSGTNLERLSHVFVSIKALEADSPSTRRNALFSPEGNSPNLFDQLIIRARKGRVPQDEKVLLRRLGIAAED